ncbi:glycosyltransferase [Bacillus wiedmannii]|uniref:glycosyltransferase n=1 Tax=Bacillus wiedmannii TaxID=1890302 RepID=UPI000BF0B66C|nr:glycosyltransferase [Bacillus wiedmannii]PEM53790.1 glycosyl transferase family 1 [Bacillus wiedmannii]PEU24514.1 glycosyl transferase family 1 [Bacillus wiedmannii]PHC86601.1 glycosyl transferase family 1 [Bacillus wiedmannii]
MNIMVFDVPAESGGALSVLNEFHRDAMLCKDKSINWFFVISKPELEETENIKILRFPWVKKSWFHRLYFDNFIANDLVKKYNIDKIFSLQNVTVPNTNVEQILYIHNSLPFVEHKFKFKENKHLWIYQNIIGRNIIRSAKKADKVIVQTEWMKKNCIEKIDVANKNINVVPPNINVEIKHYFKANEQSLATFFYPASGVDFKNHRIIVEACRKLKSKIKALEFKVYFTLIGNENKHISELYNEVKMEGLPIEFIGGLSREQVFNYYTKSILLFPSYIETFGLPMLEAKLHKGVILASNCPFSHEILDGYENAYFFDPFNVGELLRLMEDVLEGKLFYKHPSKYQMLNEVFEGEKLLDKVIG